MVPDFICSKGKWQRAFLHCGAGSLLWGPEPGEELRPLLSAISTATKAEAHRGLTARGGTKEEEGWAWRRPVLLTKQQSRGPFSSKPLSGHHILLGTIGQCGELTSAKSARS